MDRGSNTARLQEFPLRVSKREGKMKKLVSALVAGAFIFATIAPNTASAVAPPPPVVHPKPIVAGGTSSTAGAWAAGGIIGVAAFLAGYDFIRRTSCIGDPLGLGGPGFSEPQPAAGNIIPPRCPLYMKGKRKG